MSPQVTTRNFLFGKAPQKIQLLGDKTIRPEPATHIIEFPGGAIELSRTTTGEYWAHIIVNRDFALPEDVEGLRGAYGEIVGSRIDYEFPAEPNVVEVPHAAQVQQIAILIRPQGTSSSRHASDLPSGSLDQVQAPLFTDLDHPSPRNVLDTRPASASILGASAQPHLSVQ